MASLQYTIKLENIAAVGATCTDFSVEWEDDLACGNIVCVIQGDELHIEIPEDCEGECIEAVIRCNEPCTNCVPQRVTICPCDTSADCDDCSTCVDNMCLSVCDEDEFCEDGICKECNDANPCPDGKVCVDGKCVCPSGTFDNGKGECWPCDVNNVPNCYYCTREGLIPKECPEGQLCDPEDGECKDCIGSGDCAPNEICDDGDCVCKEGFLRDPITGECIEAPDCEDDSDCPPCFVCNGFGDCVPVECPDGQVCVDGECKVPCDDGTDCPDGYGCNPDTGFCEECADQDCATPDCDNLLGCNCNDSGDCVDSDNCGDQECNNAFDCPDSCVCYKGECVDCSNFSCEGCTIPGCECLNGGDCVDDPDYTCQDEVKVYKEDNGCDLIGEATLQDSCSCDPITLTIKATGTGTQESNRVQTDFRVEARKGKANNFSSANNLPRLDNTSNSVIADNDVPQTGSVNIKEILTLVEVDENGNTIPNTQRQETVYNLNLSFNDVAVVDQNNLWVYKRGELVTFNSIEYRITRVSFTAVQNDNFDFSERSGCVYESSNNLLSKTVTNSVYTALVGGTLSGFNGFVSLFSADSRNPLFKWYRNAPSASAYNEVTDVFRKVYKTDLGGGKYQDLLYGPDEIPSLDNTDLDPSEGELWSGYGYALEVDCACGDNYDDYGKVSFCQPDEISATFNTCNTTIQLGSFVPCDVNKDIDLFTGVPAKSQVFWELILNGESVGEFKHDAGTGDILSVTNSNKTLFDELSIPSGEVITTASLVQKTSVKTLCTQDIEVPVIEEREIEIANINCGFNDEYEVSIDDDQTPVDIERIIGWGSAVNGTFKKMFPKGETATITVEFIDGCKTTITLNPDCCESRNIVSEGIPAVNQGQPIPMSFNSVNLTGPITYTVYPPSLTAFSGTVSQPGDFIINIPANRVEKGEYTITFSDNTPDCEDIDVTVLVDFLGDIEIEPYTNTGVFSFCAGTSVDLFVSLSNEAVGGTLKYTRTDLSSPSLTTTQGTISVDNPNILIEEVSSHVSFQFTSLQKGGEEVFFTENVEITEEPKPTVTSIVADNSNICLGETVALTINATPNSVVTLNGGIGDVNVGESGEVVVTDTPNSVGTVTYSVVQVGNDSCAKENVTGSTVLVNVSNAPEITASADCVTQSPTSAKLLTWEVADAGGTFTAFETANSGNILSVSGGSNGDGTSTYTVTVPNGSSISAVTGEYENTNGCTVSQVQAVPTNCSCPPLTVNSSAGTVCEGTGDNIEFTITSVVVDGTTYSGGQIEVSWKDLSGTEISTDNPYSYDTTGDPVGSVQLLYDVEILTGTHQGCTNSGNVTGYIVAPQNVNIAVSGNTGSFDGTLCDGGSMEFISTLESSSYEWFIDGVSVGTNRTYTFSESAQPADYILSLEVEDENGCTSTADLDIFVTSCGCNVQYVDVFGAPELDFIEFTDGQRISLNDLQVGVFPEGTAGDDKNNDIVTQIENSLSAKNDSAAVEVFWQYIGSVESAVRFYIFASNYEFDFVRTDNNGNVVDRNFTRDCNGTEAPGCDTNTADNYNSALIGNSTGISIVDDGSCFNLYETALFASDIIGDLGNAADLDITINGSTTNVTGITQLADLHNIGSYNYNRRIVDAINAQGLDLWAELPTSKNLDDDPANLGNYTNPSGCGCTSRVEYIRLYWRFGDTFKVEATTSSCSGVDLFIDNDKSFTLQKCAGGTGNTTNINAIGKTTTSNLP